MGLRRTMRHNFWLLVMGFHRTMRRHLAGTVRLHTLVRLPLRVLALVLVRVRLLAVLVVLVVVVAQEQVDTLSGHGALVSSHEHRCLGRALAVFNHSPFRKCNCSTVMTTAAACVPSDLQTLALQLQYSSYRCGLIGGLVWRGSTSGDWRVWLVQC